MHAENRARVFDRMGDGVAFLPAAKILHRCSDTEFDFYQESSFFYLTGCDEPEAIAVLVRRDRKRTFNIYVRPKDALDELWNGARLGPAQAARLLGADAAHPLARFERHLSKLVPGQANVYLPLGAGWRWESEILRRVSSLQAFGSRKGETKGIHDIRSLIGPVRRTKSAAEIGRIREAARVTGLAFHEVMAVVRPGVREDQVRAVFDLVYGLHGALWAFTTIAGGGANACVLHYARGREVLRQGDLLLLDAGADKDHYCADVTRTIPVGGRYSPSQRRLYRIVLAAQRAAIAASRAGNRFEAVHAAAVESIVEGLLDVGLVRGRAKTIIAKKSYRRFFPHGTAHWLGLDVHDVGAYATGAGSVVLEPGMVITVEPGIYVPDDAKSPARFRGMGVRIEDDVAITKGEPVVLTEGIAREPEEVEAAMSKRSRFLKRVPIARPA